MVRLILHPIKKWVPGGEENKMQIIFLIGKRHVKLIFYRWLEKQVGTLCPMKQAIRI